MYLFFTILFKDTHSYEKTAMGDDLIKEYSPLESLSMNIQLIFSISFKSIRRRIISKVCRK